MYVIKRAAQRPQCNPTTVSVLSAGLLSVQLITKLRSVFLILEQIIFALDTCKSFIENCVLLGCYFLTTTR